MRDVKDDIAAVFKRITANLAVPRLILRTSKSHVSLSY